MKQEILQRLLKRLSDNIATCGPDCTPEECDYHALLQLVQTNIVRERPEKWHDYTVRRAESAVQSDTGIVGWNLYLVEGGAIWLTSENCAVTPEAGEVAGLYGKGFGFPVTSVTVGGRLYR